jgi:hypothetical protein
MFPDRSGVRTTGKGALLGQTWEPRDLPRIVMPVPPGLRNASSEQIQDGRVHPVERQAGFLGRSCATCHNRCDNGSALDLARPS